MQKQHKNKATANNSNSGFTNGSGHELIPVITNKDSLLVDARNLHQSLNIGRDFSNWIKTRIKDYGFIKNTDYIEFSPKLAKTPKGGRPTIEYHLTLDTAKELAMVENNEEGRKLRRYFIEAEKELRSKRLYGQAANVTNVEKLVKPFVLDGRKVYDLRKVQEVLGFSTTGGTAYLNNSYPGQVIIFNRRKHISGEVLKIMVSRATYNLMRAEAKNAKPLLPDNFGQMPLGF